MLKSRKWYSLILLLFFLLSLPFLSLSSAQESQNSNTNTPQASDEVVQAQTLTDKYKSRLTEIEQDLEGLQKRIDDGEKSLEQDAAKVPAFLQIQEVSVEEFRPFLNRWKLMRDSYAYVLQDIESQIQEVSQMHIRMDSKLQLWKIKESDAKLALTQERDPNRKSELAQNLSDIRSILKMFETESDHSDDVLANLGKAKTALSQAVDICQKNYALLEKRWEKVRFSQLKWVNQPNLSMESFNLAFQEFQFRIRNLHTYQEDFISHFTLIFKTLKNNLIRFIIVLIAWLGSGIVLLKISKPKLRSGNSTTIIEEFGIEFRKSFYISLPFLLLILAYAFLLITFSEIRESLAYFILFFLSTSWVSVLLLQSSRILLCKKTSLGRLVKIPETDANYIHLHFVTLILLTFFFSLLNFASFILNYNSEASQIFEWFLEILIFLLLLSLARPRWSRYLIDHSPHPKLIRSLRNVLHLFIFLVLLLVLVLDTLGYTLLSDYLADATLKSSGTILLFVLVKNALNEWTQHILPSLLLRKFKFQLKIVLQWAKTLQLWIRIALWSSLLYLLSLIWDLKPELLNLISFIWNWGFTVGPMKATIGLLLSVLLTFYISTLISRVLELILEKNIYPQKDWDPGIQQAFSTGVRYTLTLIALLISLRILGFDLQNITVLAGALGVGLGFGLQNIANNFASGIILLIERPIKIDDIIQINNITGRVVKIGPRSTVLETADKASILIPNGELLAGQLTNWTYGNSVAGFAIPVGVAYGSDVEKVKKLLSEIGASHENVLKDPPPRVEFKEFGDSSLNFVLRVWIGDAGERVDVQTDLMTKINNVFNENKIDIPFPQRVVLMKQEKP